MWVYSQSSGVLQNSDGLFIATGYSGAGECKNRPETQARHNQGPIPRGFYKFGKPYDSPKVGAYAIPLIPFPENEMFDRGDFLIHGDSIRDPGTASEGCIILPRRIRQLMYESDDHLLDVKL